MRPEDLAWEDLGFGLFGLRGSSTICVFFPELIRQRLVKLLWLGFLNASAIKKEGGGCHACNQPEVAYQVMQENKMQSCQAHGLVVWIPTIKWLDQETDEQREKDKCVLP